MKTIIFIFICVMFIVFHDNCSDTNLVYVNKIFTKAEINYLTNVIYINEEKNDSSETNSINLVKELNLKAREDFDIYSMIFPYMISFREKLKKEK